MHGVQQYPSLLLMSEWRTIIMLQCLRMNNVVVESTSFVEPDIIVTPGAHDGKNCCCFHTHTQTPHTLFCSLCHCRSTQRQHYRQCAFLLSYDTAPEPPSGTPINDSHCCVLLAAAGYDTRTTCSRGSIQTIEIDWLIDWFSSNHWLADDWDVVCFE